MLGRFRQLRRVVITGIGCVTPIGIGREAFWSALCKGESGVRRIEAFDISQAPVKIAAEVRGFDWEAQVNPKDRKHVPRIVPLAWSCGKCNAFQSLGKTGWYYSHLQTPATSNFLKSQVNSIRRGAPEHSEC